jgi:hypothetical protein
VSATTRAAPVGGRQATTHDAVDAGFHPSPARAFAGSSRASNIST